MVPWCRSEAPVKAAVSVCSLHCFPPFFSPSLMEITTPHRDDNPMGRGNLPKLDLQINKGTDFNACCLQWKSYCSLSRLANEGASKQVEALSLCFLREALAIVQNLGLTNYERKDVTAIIEALQSYVDGHLNETVEQRNFCRRKQQPGETFHNFLISLRELAKSCKFCSEVCMEKNIRDQVIEGV